MQANRWLHLLVFLAIVLLIQWAGHKMTFVSVRDWYLTLQKPTWTPPAPVFGPVWAILYLSIAISGWLAWTRTNLCKIKRIAFFFYGSQLAANLLWSYLFFSRKSPFMGLIDLSLLVILIGFNILYFLRLDKLSGFLLIPYFLWSLYALSLNFEIWRLNR